MMMMMMMMMTHRRDSDTVTGVCMLILGLKQCRFHRLQLSRQLVPWWLCIDLETMSILVEVHWCLPRSSLGVSL